MEYQSSKGWVVIDEHSQGGYSIDLFDSQLAANEMDDPLDGIICEGNLHQAVDWAMSDFPPVLAA